MFCWIGRVVRCDMNAQADRKRTDSTRVVAAKASDSRVITSDVVIKKSIA